MLQANKRRKKRYKLKSRSNEGCNDMKPIVNKINAYANGGNGYLNAKGHKTGEGMTIYNLVWDGEKYIETNMLTSENSIDPTSAAFSKKMSKEQRYRR